MTSTTMASSERRWASHSELSMHRVCPERWQYRYVRRLSRADPDDVKVEMHLGSWWHALRAADSIQRGRQHDSLKWAPQRLTTVDDGPTFSTESQYLIADVMDGAEKWWIGQTPRVKDEWEARIGGDVVTRLAAMNERWYDQWGSEIATEHPMAVELFWKRALPQSEMDLLGYVDEVYYDSRRAMVVVRDHKTSKTLATQTTVDDMMDSQLQLYAWGASPTVTSWGMGPIRATAYDRIRMVAPRPPTLTQAGKISVRDGQPSVSSCDQHTYLEWCDSQPYYPGTKKDGSGAGVYQAEPTILEKLGSPAFISSWFQRTTTPLNMNLIRSHLRAAVDSAEDLTRTRERAEITREAARNLGAACRWCDFARLCRAEMIGGADGEYDLADYMLVQR